MADDTFELKIVRCAIYIRVSSDEQAKGDRLSLQMQEECGMETIRKHQKDCWVYVKTFSDPGYIGHTWDRPGLLQLIAAARAREIDMVVVYLFLSCVWLWPLCA